MRAIFTDQIIQIADKLENNWRLVSITSHTSHL